MIRRLIDRRTDERGVIAIIAGIAATTMFVAGALAVDLGNTWARRGNLQGQADQAALFAAHYLPANDDAGKTKVARQVAWYIACHPVQGQSQLSTIPACPGDSTVPSAAIDAYADTLLAKGMVTFPDHNQVSVTTPPARVDFAFGQVAGAKGTVQQKTASARVQSPGFLEPFGLSLNCLLTVADNLPASLGTTISDDVNAQSGEASIALTLNHSTITVPLKRSADAGRRTITRVR